MSFVSDKLDLFCEKAKKIPLSNSFGDPEFWEEFINNKFSDTLQDHWLDKWYTFSWGGEPSDFYNLSKEVISEIDHNIKAISGEFDFKKYLAYLKHHLLDRLSIMESYSKRLKNVKHPYSEDEFKSLGNTQKTNYLILFTVIVDARDCCNTFVSVSDYIKEQELLYIGESFEANKQSIEIGKISEKISHKILLLYELGVIENLQKEYFSAKQNLRNETDFANLIANIIGEPLKIETVRKNLSGLNLAGGKQSVKTKPAIREVKKYLSSLNIGLKRLNDNE